MEAFDFTALLPPEVRAQVAQIKDPARRVLENKVRAYNELPGAEDGSGVNCPACRNKGYVAVLDEDGPRMVVRYCACRSRRSSAPPWRWFSPCSTQVESSARTVTRFQVDSTE